MSSEQLYQAAEAGYKEYAAVTDGKNFLGNPMPEFKDLPEKIQQAWVAFAKKVSELAIEQYAKDTCNDAKAVASHAEFAEKKKADAA